MLSNAIHLILDYFFIYFWKTQWQEMNIDFWKFYIIIPINKILQLVKSNTRKIWHSFTLGSFTLLHSILRLSPFVLLVWLTSATFCFVLGIFFLTFDGSLLKQSTWPLSALLFSFDVKGKKTIFVWALSQLISTAFLVFEF